ncbi:hypothetical protein GR160_12670 [Flavobacterium sp. Sd200]|uniref:hypothetical protein n=1 Tax=Flavobacterium sp. Sd200 TaxID=2692211 RepID=UPI00136A6D8D|nr:hypothetical protein [Flavobacterium sp. Sd200]MXN92081.1 hypothetical protein [Flavobacterium sp. Sd200]
MIAINHNSYDEPVVDEEWKITAYNTEKINGFSDKILLPYTKLQLLEKHTLLHKYHDEELECEIQGIPNNLNQLTFDLIKLEQQLGNWISIKDMVGSYSPNMFKIPKRITIPNSFEEKLSDVFKTQELSFKIRNYNKGYEYTPDAKMLIFGNEDVCPNRLNGGQSYIIADEFKAERLK